MKIGVLADCFGLGLEGGLKKASALGAQGVQLYAVEGEMAPENMDAKKCLALNNMVKRLNLEISALCGDLGEGGFAFKEHNPWKIERTKEIVRLAETLEVPVVTTHIGVVPHDPAHPRFAVIRDALAELGAYACERGIRFAIETGPESGEDLRRMIDAVASPGIGVNLDPANLVMGHVDTPVHAVEMLGPYIVHTHAKDGICFKEGDADIMYGMVPAQEDFDESEYCAEVPLGEGEVHFDTYIEALRKAGFDGFLTIEREVGEDPGADMAKAITFLRQYV